MYEQDMWYPRKKQKQKKITATNIFSAYNGLKVLHIPSISIKKKMSRTIIEVWMTRMFDKYKNGKAIVEIGNDHMNVTGQSYCTCIQTQWTCTRNFIFLTKENYYKTESDQTFRHRAGTKTLTVTNKRKTKNIYAQIRKYWMWTVFLVFFLLDCHKKNLSKKKTFRTKINECSNIVWA